MTGGVMLWRRFVVAVTVVAAVGLLAWAAFLGVRAHTFSQDSEHVSGTVVDVSRYATSDSGGQDQHTTQDVTFEYVVGGETVRGVWVNDNRTWVRGQSQDLLVDPKDPTSPRLAGAWGLYRTPMVYAGLGVLLGVIAPAIHWVLRRPPAQTRRSQTRR